MSTLACKLWRRERFPLLAGVGCLALALVYQAFGHGVRSWAMTLCCLPPWAFALAEMWREKRLPGAPQAIRQWLGAAAATLSAGLFLQGILEIAGTDSPYLCLFYLLGAAEAVLALGQTVRALITMRRERANDGVHIQF